MTQTAGKIRVCFISMKAYPIFNPAVQKVFGGAEVDLYLLATELAKDAGLAVSFVVADYGQANEEVREGVRLLKGLNSEQNALTGAMKVWKAMKRANADIYMHEAASWGTALAAAFCTFYRRKFVYRTASCRETDGRYFAANRMEGFCVRWAMRTADVLITQNQQDADNTKRTIGREATVIRNGCRLPPQPEQAKDIILWAGRSLPVKRPELFLELARAFPKQPFVMICQQGTGDRTYERLAEDAALIANLTFVRRVPFHEIDRYFERAMIFVNTSDSEGFPNTFVQAAAAGAAILSYTVNPDDFLTQYNCGLNGSGDMDKLKRQLAFLLENSRFHNLGRNARRYVEQTHDIRRIVEEYKPLFSRLVRDSGQKEAKP